MKPRIIRVLILLLAATLLLAGCTGGCAGGGTASEPSDVSAPGDASAPDGSASDDVVSGEDDDVAFDNNQMGVTDMDNFGTGGTTYEEFDWPNAEETELVTNYTITGTPLAFVTSSTQTAFKRVDGGLVKVYDASALDRDSGTVIDIVPDLANQEIIGFGASLTESAAYSLYQIPEAERNKVMERLFDPQKGIGLSFLRNTIGSSDFALTGDLLTLDDKNAQGLPIGPYSYDDVPEGQEDWDLKQFSIDRDKSMVIPLLKQALALNPKLTFMATPWTAPAWMKTEHTLYGFVTVDGEQRNASLREDCYQVYADYFVKYLKAMQKEGIPIWAVTPQNEPGTAIHYPSMVMTLDEQLVFTRDYLVPTLRKNGLDTKVLGLDNNWHTYANALTLLFGASDVFDGIAFHGYSSNGKVQQNIYSAFPEKTIVLSEESGMSRSFMSSALFHSSKIVSHLRNYGSGYILWNLALSNKKGPLTYQPGSKCDPLVTVNYVNDDGTEEYKGYGYTGDFYALAHYSKFIRPGARQVFSTETAMISNVACLNTDGTLACVLNNSTIKPITAKLVVGEKVVEYTVPENSIATLVWDANK